MECHAEPSIRGVTTSPMPDGTLMLQIDFDFIDHVLVLETSEGNPRTIPLRPMTVAEVYRRLMSALHEVSCSVRIWPNPVEIVEPIPFENDSVHQSYDPEYVSRFWRILLQTTRVFTIFRSKFRAR